jgi:hypothetical protein
MNTVVGIYDHINAQRAIEVLEDYGVDHDEISMVARDINMVEPQAPTCAFNAPEFGQVIATGALGIQLFMTIESKTVSSLSDALMDIGFSEEAAEIYVEGMKRGDILVSVESGTQKESIS